MLNLETRDGISVLRMEHGKANAQDIEFCTAIADRMSEIERLPSRAVLITGHGRFFSGGVDLKRVQAGGVHYLREFLPALVRCFESAFFHPKPVVVAVNGHAIAGGCILACCGDRRLMVDDERAGIGVPELYVGVPFPAVALEILRFSCSPAQLQKLVCTGRSPSAPGGTRCRTRGCSGVLRCHGVRGIRGRARARECASRGVRPEVCVPRCSRRPSANCAARSGTAFGRTTRRAAPQWRGCGPRRRRWPRSRASSRRR